MDPIADALTIIRNGSKNGKRVVNIPASYLKERIVDIFKKEGYIEDYQFIKDNKQGILRVYLKYKRAKSTSRKGEKPAIMGLKRISRPGRRVYVTKEQIPYVLDGLGRAIISASQGVLSDKEAREIGVGGEIICYIW
ncbi:MAG: 30S ribosomal protein S8 [Candidatus Omnitrophica bacterium 4484_213]|nr:MAG: 30S ribosomal protein S8 [Candidatus Omnitrophica bacterium 4484_213]